MTAKLYNFPSRPSAIDLVKRDMREFYELRKVLTIDEYLALNHEFTTRGKLQKFNPNI